MGNPKLLVQAGLTWELLLIVGALTIGLWILCFFAPVAALALFGLSGMQ